MIFFEGTDRDRDCADRSSDESVKGQEMGKVNNYSPFFFINGRRGIALGRSQSLLLSP